MKACDVKEMLTNSYEDPCFFINFHNVGRGIIGDSDHRATYIKGTRILNCWRIIGDKLQKVGDEYYGILFDAEAYLFQWMFEYVEKGTTQEDTLFYYWKGINASKGYSPLLPEFEDQSPVVERICQWSEPALFFHMFSKAFIVFSGTYKKFNPNVNRLFMLRGELPSEMHLYEVPCLKESLRGRGIFLLINPSESTIYYWYGSSVPNKHQQLSNLIKLNTRNEHWANFKTVEIRDGYENNSFFQILDGESNSYIRLPHNDFTPRLFYFYCSLGDFSATEVEYPLRSKQHKAAFPFLQSHLYTADQPGRYRYIRC